MTTLTLTPAIVTERVIGRTVRSDPSSLRRFRRPVWSSERGLREVVAVQMPAATDAELDEIHRVFDEVGGVGGVFEWQAPGRPSLENYLFLTPAISHQQATAAKRSGVSFEVERTD